MFAETAIAVDRQLANTFELQEAAYWSDYYKAADSETIKRLGIQFENIGGAHVMAAADIDILAFNRVIGLGIQSPATESQIDDIISIYKDAGVSRFFIQASPHAMGVELFDLLEEKGFQFHNNWARLYRPIFPMPLPKGNVGLRIEPITAAKRDIFANIIVDCFEWPSALTPLVGAVVGRPGWRHYLVYTGKTPIACAAAYFNGDVASLAFAATLPEFRGYGSQLALISRRFEDAAANGCQWMTVETAENKPERRVASYRNMIRSGFDLAYLRPNYLLEL